MISLFAILLTIQVLISVCMGGLILIQRSEGGALGMGGGPAGFMSARGTGNLLTTATAWFAFFFFANSIALTVVGNLQNHTKSAVDTVDTSTLTLTPEQRAQESAAAAAGAVSSSSANALPLSNLPLAGSVPVQQTPPPTVTAPVRPAATSSSASLPAKLPASLPGLNSASASSPTADQIAKAKASVFHTSSASAPASSASKAAAPAPAAATPPASSSSTTPQ